MLGTTRIIRLSLAIAAAMVVQSARAIPIEFTHTIHLPRTLTDSSDNNKSVTNLKEATWILPQFDASLGTLNDALFTALFSLSLEATAKAEDSGVFRVGAVAEGSAGLIVDALLPTEPRSSAFVAGRLSVSPACSVQSPNVDPFSTEYVACSDREDNTFNRLETRQLPLDQLAGAFAFFQSDFITRLNRCGIGDDLCEISATSVVNIDLKLVYEYTPTPIDPPAGVDEPAMLATFGSGIAAFVGIALTRRRRSASARGSSTSVNAQSSPPRQ